MLAEFSLKLLHSTMFGKIFKFMAFTFLENALIRGIFTCAPPTQNFFSKFLSSCPRQKGKLLIPQGSIVSKIWFIQQQKGVEDTMICFIKSQPENMKMTWNIRFFYILCDLQFFQIWWFYNFVNNIYYIVWY